MSRSRAAVKFDSLLPFKMKSDLRHLLTIARTAFIEVSETDVFNSKALMRCQVVASLVTSES